MSGNPEFPNAEPRKKLVITFDDEPEAQTPPPAPAQPAPPPPAPPSPNALWSGHADAPTQRLPPPAPSTSPPAPAPRAARQPSPAATAAPQPSAPHSSQPAPAPRAAPQPSPPAPAAPQPSAPHSSPPAPAPRAAPQPSSPYGSPPPPAPYAATPYAPPPTQPFAPPQWPAPQAPSGWAAPAPRAAQGHLSSWGLRFVATLVDGALTVAVTLAVVFLVGASVFGMSSGSDPDTAGAMGFFAAILAYLAVSTLWGLLYAPLTMMRGGARNGQTLGKQLVGIRVARLDGAPVTAGTAVMRDVVMKSFVIWGLGSLLLSIPGILDSLWPLWDGQRQSWHDKAVSTIVVDA